MTEGQILAGKYRVDRVLMVGGMGVVVAAYNLLLATKVALKFLHPHMLGNQEAVARFTREAQTLAQIHSEHVVRVHDVGTLDNGAPYMVMEFLEGGDLASWVRDRGPLPIEQAADFLLQAGVAIADAHALGIVHRDLKPANLFCVRRSDGQLVIKLLDFGISKQTDLTRSSEPQVMSLTETTAIIGTPFYMSPEQAQSAKDVDARTDIWALGVILFQLVTGAVPFQGEAFGEVAVKIAVQKPPSLRSYRPEAPPGLEAVIRKCLEKDRQRRYPNVAELALALLPFAPRRAKALVERVTGIIQAAGLSASALALPPSPKVHQEREATLAVPGSVAPWSGSPKKSANRKALVRLVRSVSVVALVGGGVGVWAFLHRPLPQEKSPANDPPPRSDPQPAPTGAASCASGSTQCDGSRPQTCERGQWVSGSVTAGQCGATCTPDSSPSRCNGGSPQTCLASGQWQDVPCRLRSQTCRDGICVDSPPPPPPPAPRPKPTPTPEAAVKPNCDPNFYLDAQGEKRFKPECFGVPPHSSSRPAH